MSGYGPWGCKELDLPEATKHAHNIHKMLPAVPGKVSPGQMLAYHY